MLFRNEWFVGWLVWYFVVFMCDIFGLVGSWFWDDLLRYWIGWWVVKVRICGSCLGSVMVDEVRWVDLIIFGLMGEL